VIAKESKLNALSVHHLYIADVNEKLINHKVVAGADNLVNIIETARKLR
jgi:hypothetical protein